MKVKKLSERPLSIFVINDMYGALKEANYALKEMLDGTSLVSVIEAIKKYEKWLGPRFIPGPDSVYKRGSKRRTK